MADTVIINDYGTKYYYRDDRLHRDDGPAVEEANGAKRYYRNGQLHRDGGPAIEYADGTKRYYCDGLHVGTYHPNFGCAANKLKTRADALVRLNSKTRCAEVVALYMADIDAKWPEQNS